MSELFCSKMCILWNESIVAQTNVNKKHQKTNEQSTGTVFDEDIVWTKFVLLPT